MPAAHGFITSHPWASEICAQINLAPRFDQMAGGLRLEPPTPIPGTLCALEEAAGSGGRELLFQVLS